MRHKPWADEEEDEPGSLGWFIIGLLGGTMAAYNAGGWIPVSLGWISGKVMLMICAAIGVLAGIYLAREARKN